VLCATLIAIASRIVFERWVQFITEPVISSEFGMMTSARSKVSISVRRTEMPHRALLSPDDDPVADLDRPLDQQQQAGDEIVDDLAQPEADTDRQRACDDGEVRQVEPHRGDSDDRRDQDADIIRGHRQRVAHAAVEARARQDLGIEQPRRIARRHHPADEDRGADDDIAGREH
jgi:hypothetical protein